MTRPNSVSCLLCRRSRRRAGLICALGGCGSARLAGIAARGVMPRRFLHVSTPARLPRAARVAAVWSPPAALERQLSPAPVRADARWMHQVVTNLLGNSAKFTPAGGLVILSPDTHGVQATLSVSDSGFGITPEQLPQLFERFWRGANTTGAAGSGIGLAVVAEVVRGHGGDLRASSTPGRGTLIVVARPLALPPRRCPRRQHPVTTFTASR